jgi:hypothetical protein
MRAPAGGLALSILLLVLAAPASADELLNQRVTVGQAVDSSCIDGLRSGAGVARRDFDAPSTGALTAKLRAASGDWDVAVFRRGGVLVAGGTGSGASEVAGGFAFKGERLTLQACRRSGAGAANLTVDLDEIDTSAKPAKTSLVNVATPSRAHKRKLQKLGLDLTEHGGATFVGVLLHGPADAAKLRKAGFQYKIEVGDLAAADRKAAAADQRFKGQVTASALPSGRTGYRRLADYTEEMKKLVADNPGLVKSVQLPFKTWEGRTVEGIEITTDVNARDGKPVFVQLGVHHAREWPSGEHAMEWAYELVNGYKANNVRARELVEGTRTIIVPIVNPDGFNISREVGFANGANGGRGSPNPGEENETANIVAHPGEYRRKNCRFADDSEGGTCAQPAAGVAAAGVDPNRNYGAFWGGGGASADPTNETYRGHGPFSEPETRNVRSLVSTRQVVTLITNHTFSNLVLRPPGIQAQGETVDEPVYKQLGAEMTAENGYSNDFGYQLYDTSGTTEDWSYNATGGLGFTYEIGCITKNAQTGECTTGHFHPPFAEMVKEYEGQTAFSDANGRDGKGNREAYFKAQESTANQARHSVLTGSAPPGAILRLRKVFQTPTEFAGSSFEDVLDTTLRVPASGRFEWHINPSTRPLVAKDKGRNPTGPPSAPIAFSGDPSGPPGDGAVPGGDANTTNPLFYNEHAFTVPSDGDNATATIRAEWASPASDWDMKIYEDSDGSGTVSAGDPEVGASEQGTTDFEQTTLAEPILGAGKKFVVRLTNFAATEPYEGSITFKGPNFVAAQREAWTLTCENNAGTAFKSAQVFIDRGQRQSQDFAGCGLAASGKDKREKPRVKSRMSAKRSGRYFRVKVKGGLVAVADKGNPLPQGSKAQRCAGRVKVAVKVRRKTLKVSSPRVNSKCKFSRTIKVKRSSVSRAMRGSRRLTLRAYSRYTGSKYLLPAKQTKSKRVSR